jgi:hypothetical protein
MNQTRGEFIDRRNSKVTVAQWAECGLGVAGLWSRPGSAMTLTSIR